MKRRMVLHNVKSYPVAIAREEALLLAADLVRAEAGRKWRKTAPALLRHHLVTGTLPEGVSTAASMAAFGTQPAMAEPVSEWVTQALTERTRMAVKVAKERRVIEASGAPAADTPPQRQTAGPKAVSSRARKAAKVREMLADTDSPMTREEVARKAGVSVSTVDRIKKTMPTPLHAVAR